MPGTTPTGKVLRGQYATFISKDKENWTLMGVRNDSMETATNADESNGKDVTGGSYTDVAGFNPETAVDYIANKSDSIFQPLWENYKGLKKDDESLTFWKIEALLDIEVSETNEVTSASGDGFMVPVKAIITSIGGGTDATHFAVSFREDHTVSKRVQGTVTVSNRQPTFAPESSGLGS